MAKGVGLYRVTIVCTEPCQGWPCFECEMVIEAMGAARPSGPGEPEVDLAHKSVEEANSLWSGAAFSDLDTPYLVVNDDVRISGREWRTASLDALASMLSGAFTRK